MCRRAPSSSRRAARASPRVSVDAFGDLDQKSPRRTWGCVAIWAAPTARRRRWRWPGGSRRRGGRLRREPREPSAAVRRLARGRELLGNSPATLAARPRLREPGRDRAPRRRPRSRRRSVRATPRRPGTRWLRKPLRGGGGSGGAGPRGGGPRRRGASSPRSGSTACSASVSFVADGRRAVLLGVSRGLAGDSAFGARGYRYCGSLYPLVVESALLDRASTRSRRPRPARFGLIGRERPRLRGPRRAAFVLELNPRYSASMELLERAAGPRRIRRPTPRPVEARVPAAPSPGPSLGRGVFGKAILWARRDVVAGDTRRWLERDDVRDVPFPGERIRRGHPICTVFARGRRRGRVPAAPGRAPWGRSRRELEPEPVSVSHDPGPDRGTGRTRRRGRRRPRQRCSTARACPSSTASWRAPSKPSARRRASPRRSAASSTPRPRRRRRCLARCVRPAGLVTASLGDLRQHADLVVFWGCDPDGTHSGLRARFLAGAERTRPHRRRRGRRARARRDRRASDADPDASSTRSSRCAPSCGAAAWTPRSRRRPGCPSKRCARWRRGSVAAPTVSSSARATRPRTAATRSAPGPSESSSATRTEGLRPPRRRARARQRRRRRERAGLADGLSRRDQLRARRAALRIRASWKRRGGAAPRRRRRRPGGGRRAAALPLGRGAGAARPHPHRAPASEPAPGAERPRLHRDGAPRPPRRARVFRMDGVALRRTPAPAEREAARDRPTEAAILARIAAALPAPPARRREHDRAPAHSRRPRLRPHERRRRRGPRRLHRGRPRRRGASRRALRVSTPAVSSSWRAASTSTPTSPARR